jgi:HK97 family phage major capsid protein
MAKSQIPVFVTEELMEDVAAMDSYVRTELAGKMAAILDYEILVGSGGGYAAVIGDTGYTAAQTFTGTPTLSELNACVNKVLGNLNPEFYMSITMWNLFVNTFANSAGNIGLSIINVGAKTLMGYKVNVVPYLGTTGLVFGDFSRYTVIEAPIADKLQVSNDVRFLEGEIVFKLTHRGAGAITTANLATVDSLTQGAFVQKA